MRAVFRHELSSYFTGVTGYVFSAFLLLFTGIYTMVYNLQSASVHFEYVLGSMSFVFLIIVPILTMRVLAEERRQKTDQLLYSLPLTMTQVVLGKFAAMLVVFAAPMAVICLYPVVLSAYGNVYLPAAYGAIVGFFFLGMALLAIGMYISSVTESQAVAAGLCFVVMLVNTPDRSINILKAEMPGPTVDKLVPKVQSTAKILYGIYFGLTVIEFVFLLFGGMPVFEALLTSFGTAGTGGFGFRNDSFASMSPYVQWVVTIFMILFGVNFNAYFLLLMRRFRRAAASEEVRAYFVIIGVAVVIITANIYSMYNGLGEALRHAAFQVGSIITTTGFSSCDFDLWPTLSKEILVMLMFVGACAGSTGGGMKVSRLLLMGKTVGKELKQALHPQVVAPVRMDGKVVNHETIRATNVYVAAYIFIFAASFFLISLDDFDMVTNFTAIAATLNNIGPGLAQVGPMMNFGSYSNPAKLVMIFDMLAGRLEIFPMLVFFMPDTWRRF